MGSTAVVRSEIQKDGDFMLKDEGKTEESSFYKSYKSNLLVISFIISVILIGSLIVFTKISSLYSYLENEKTQESQKASVELSVVISDSGIVLNDTVSSSFGTKIQNNLIVVLVIYFILVVAVILLLIFLAISDDSGIRFAKLNELRNFRKQYFDSFAGDFHEYETIKNGYLKKIKTNMNIDTSNMLCKSDISVGLKFPFSESHKKKNVKEELLKNYMNSVVEI